MPQEINLNISPYFDDFDENSNYYKVLFKPGYPVQARELTTSQSILQNQIEKLGDHVFKEGAKVLSGDTSYNAYYNAVELNNNYLGIDVSSYIKLLIGKKIRGENSNVVAEVINAITSEESERGNATIYVSYLSTSSNDNETAFFLDGETLVLEESIVTSAVFFNTGESIASTIPFESTSFGSSFEITEGVYYLRGHFVNVKKQLIILDQYTNTPDYRIGFTIVEDIVTSDSDSSLTDNAKGFNNYAAPGADRLKITAILDKKELSDTSSENFVEIARIQRGIVRNTPNDPLYNIINDKFAKRTYEESGDYYVKRFKVSCKDSLNDNLGNNGVFSEGTTTYDGNTPREDLAIYEISPGKAYVRGYEVEINSPTFIDIEKPRTIKETDLQSITYSTGPSLALNRVSGCPVIGIGNSYTVNLRSKRIGSSGMVNIGVARVVDFALEEGSYSSVFPESNRWDISLYDVQTYTIITLNQPITLSIPTYVVGNSSGAFGYLRSQVNNGTSLTLYNVSGQFIKNESFTFNGVRDNRVAISINSYGLSDVKSIYSNQSSVEFFADVVQQESYSIGISTISAVNGTNSIATISLEYLENIKVGNIVRYTNPSSPAVPTYNEVVAVSSNDFSTLVTLAAVQSVSGVCNGSLPTSEIITSNFSILKGYVISSGNTLYTALPKKNIASVDLSESELIIRKQYPTSITSSATETIPADDNEFFLPYDEERYILRYSDGSIEPLTFDQFNISEDGKTLSIRGLSVAADADANLTATLRKISPKSKIKKKSRARSLVIDKSLLRTSGIGTTTKNDGLVYGNYPYGTRVQDNEICLNVPDVISVHGIFESRDISTPSAPKMTLSSILSPNSSTIDIILGENLVGGNSDAIAICVGKPSSNQIEFVYKNENEFFLGEVVTFKESGVTAVVGITSDINKNITKNYTLDNGQKESYYDYSKIIRNSDTLPPQRKIRIYYDSTYYDSQDVGDITTANSYQNFDYNKEASFHNGNKTTDIIDIRPRVSEYVVGAGKRSPFEFYGRTFDPQGNSASNVLAQDESITLKYKFYLPRIDRIFINKNGQFVVEKGVPSENPAPPIKIDDSVEIAQIFLPPYLYNTNKVSITSYDYKRYQMSDISKLETRIKNLEYYTTLSLLETETSSMFIPDANGLNRFKSGFFVDNFSSRTTQDPNTGIKNAIDPSLKLLRPSHYTTSIDLSVATNLTDDSSLDIKNITSEQILGENIKKSGDIITLDYTSVEFLKQPYATRVESVHPFILTFWEGSLELSPPSDIWVDTVRIESTTITVDNYTPSLSELGVDPQTGLGPEIWNDWVFTGFGESRFLDARPLEQGGNEQTVAVRNEFMNWRAQQPGTLQPGAVDPNWINSGLANQAGLIPTAGFYVEQIDAISMRTGSQLAVTETTSTESLGDFMVSSQLQTYMRSRNVEFRGSDFKPNTRIYAFFGGINVTSFCFPKLIQISMQSGVFQVGETVDIKNTNNTQVVGSFRVASANHKFGIYNSPTQVYTQDPFTNQSIPTTYTSASSLLNIDISSLSTMEESNYYGLIRQNFVLVGRTSGASATVTNTNLIVDKDGDIIGSFFIPNPNGQNNPKFQNGIQTFRLTSNSTNNFIPGTPGTAAETQYFASGSTNTTQERILSVRSPVTSTRILQEQQTVAQFTGVYTDPLAQSFVCDEPTGVFLTKLDVYFQAKDNELPVSCEIRTMELGTPTRNVLPFSRVALTPNRVNISNDASLPTTFEFPSPVYIEGGQEYAIVILSNSNAYYVWISSILGRDPNGDEESGSFRTPVDTLTGQTITSQPTLGSLFKSQNASTWTPSQFEDLKFTLYRSNFNTAPATINFYNPPLSVANNQIAKLLNNSLDFDSRKLRINLSSPLSADLPFGTTVIQPSTGAYGNYASRSGSVSQLTIDNPGFGYPEGSYPNVELINITGRGSNIIANITISAEGEISSITVVQGGSGYQEGNVLEVPGLGNDNLGVNGRVSVNQLGSYPQIILEDVQGDFNEGVGVGNSLQYYNASNTLVYINGGNATIESPIEVDSDGLHIKVNHKNHGMHSPLNYVTISGVFPDTRQFNIVTPINSTSNSISVSNSEDFSVFEGLPVNSSNPGYAFIGNEIIKYSSAGNGILSGVVRGIDGTIPSSYSANTVIRKYELNGVSLLRINTTHRLEDSIVENSIGLDYYTIRIDQMAKNSGNIQITRRDSDSLLGPSLYFREDKFDGGNNIRATQNMQFEVLTPLIQNFTPNQTSISSQVRTVSATSISGNELSFIDQGYSEITLGTLNYFDSPRLIASKINENEMLSELPKSKSLNVLVNMSSSDSRLSPCIDLTKTSIITTSNRVNKAVSDNEYITDRRINTITEDPNAFMYVSKQIRLQNPASSIKLLVSADINSFCDIRALYSIDNSDNSNSMFELFPGYNNLTNLMETIDPSLNDGTPDVYMNTNNNFGFEIPTLSEYEFTVNNLPEFTYYRVKIILTSTNQAYVPKVKDIRAIALA